MSPDKVQQALLQASKDDVGNFSKYVAVARFDDGSATLLRRSALSELCMQLSHAEEDGSPAADELPCVVQVRDWTGTLTQPVSGGGGSP